MKTSLTIRSLCMVAFAAGLALGVTGCADTSNVSNIAGSTGPSGQNDVRSSGVGPGGHQPATNSAANIGPTGAGPAGSQ